MDGGFAQRNVEPSVDLLNCRLRRNALNRAKRVNCLNDLDPSHCSLLPRACSRLTVSSTDKAKSIAVASEHNPIIANETG